MKLEEIREGVVVKVNGLPHLYDIVGAEVGPSGLWLDLARHDDRTIRRQELAINLSVPSCEVKPEKSRTAGELAPIHESGPIYPGM